MNSSQQMDLLKKKIELYSGMHTIIFVYVLPFSNSINEICNYYHFGNNVFDFDKNDYPSYMFDQEKIFITGFDGSNDHLSKLISIYNESESLVIVFCEKIFQKRNINWTYLSGRYIEYRLYNDTFMEWADKNNSTNFSSYLSSILHNQDYNQEKYERLLNFLMKNYEGPYYSNEFKNDFDKLIHFFSKNTGRKILVNEIIFETGINARYIRYLIRTLKNCRIIDACYTQSEHYARISSTAKFYFFSDLLLLNYLTGNEVLNKLDFNCNVLYLEMAKRFARVDIVELRNGLVAFLGKNQFNRPVLAVDTFLTSESFSTYADELEFIAKKVSNSSKGYDLNVISYFSNSRQLVNNVNILNLYDFLRHVEKMELDNE